MAGFGKYSGLILIGTGAFVEVCAVAWLFSSGTLERGAGGFVLGLVLAQVVAVPLFAIGIFLFIKGRQESAEFALMEQQRAILNAVQVQGRVSIAELALQLKLTRDQLHAHIRDLVGKGLFTGFINWKEGVLVAKTAAEMQTTKCPNCGGERQVVGKGVVQCPYCGSELYIP